MTGARWIPIHNSSSAYEYYGPLGLLPLAITIALVAFFLLSLIYLTVRSYKFSAHNQSVEDPSDDCTSIDHYREDFETKDYRLFVEQERKTPCFCNYTQSQIDHTNETSGQSLYKAHIYRYGQAYLSCSPTNDTVATANGVVLPSSNIKYCNQLESYDPCIGSCCSTNSSNRPTQAINWSRNYNQSNNINMIENPLALD